MRILTSLRPWPKLHRTAGPLGRLLLSTLIVAVGMRSYLGDWSALGAHGDIRNFHFWWEVSASALRDYGQLPFWNPYYCGGMVHWANVQTMFLYPTGWLGMLLGAGPGIRLHILVHFVLGFWGFLEWIRLRNLKTIWALFPATVFVFGANLVERSTGHLSFLHFLWLPWIALCLEKARCESRWRWLASAIVGMSVLAGGPYPFAILAVWLGLNHIWDSCARGGEAARGKRLRVATEEFIRGLPALTLPALLIPAAKLFPVIDFMSEYPRQVTEAEFLRPWQLWEALSETDGPRLRKAYAYVFGEYRSNVGPLALAAVAALMGFADRWPKHFFLLAVCLLLSAGHFAPWAPYSLLQELPVFGSLRVPARWLIPATFSVATLFGVALAEASGWLGRREHLAWGAAEAALWFVCLASAVDLIRVNTAQTYGWFQSPAAKAQPADNFHHVAGSSGAHYRAIRDNRGHVDCYEPNPIPSGSGLRLGALPQVWFEGMDRPARIAEWTPNQVTVAYDAGPPGTLIWNMNFHRDWRASNGRTRARGGLVAVPVSSDGGGSVILSYRPRRIWLYAVLSLAGVGLTLFQFRRRRPYSSANSAKPRGA